MDSINIVCPVCTLYLRPGITLKEHLTSHPKQKVIEALVKLASVDEPPKSQNVTSTSSFSPPLSSAGTSTSQVNSTVANPSWNQSTPVQLGPPSHMNSLHGNHVFIYQQSMSTSAPQGNVLQVNPMSQQYVYHPAVFSPQMMPYMYQQQQVILASNSVHPQIRALPFELSDSEATDVPEVATIENNNESQKQTPTEIEKDTIENGVFSSERQAEESPNKTITKKELDSLHHEHEIKTMEDFEQEQTQVNEIPPEEYHDSADENDLDITEREELVASPYSEHADWKDDSELSKACQTQQASTHSPTSPVIAREHLVENENQFANVDQPEYFYLDPQSGHYTENFQEQENNETPPYSVHKKTDNYEQSEPIYTSANILHGNDHLDFMNLDDIVIIGEFNSNPVASQVEHFENTLHDRPRVLMTIGEIPDHQKIDCLESRDFEESMSRSSSHVNIRSDERMPARGELSGQESLGGNSDISNWNRLHYQEGGSYEIIEHESWQASDSESIDTPSMKRQNSTQVSCEQNGYDDNDLPTIIGYSGPPLNFKCSTCGEDFASSKDRKEHELENHPEKSKCTIIGSEIGKKNVKKLVIRAKSESTKTEPNFDNIFTNKLKLESQGEVVTGESASLETPVKTDEPPVELADIKTICPICECVLENAKCLKQHKLEMHKETATVKHKCLTCGEVFPNEYKYTDHLKVHPLECRLCGKLFYRKQNIRLHMKRHLGLKPYKCEICEKSFVTRQKHDEHKNIHTGKFLYIFY